MNRPGGIPDLGAKKQMQQFGANLSALPLHVDAAGAVCDASGERIMLPQGESIPRQHYLDGDQLLHALQAAMRYELRAFAEKLGRQDVADAMVADDEAALRELVAAAQREQERDGADGQRSEYDGTLA